jgi:DNA helicase-2/ATP-dependent DNA helicase PcrA
MPSTVAAPAGDTSGVADSLLSRLNPAQQRAVLHGDAPLLVVAGAGTGKTTTLAARVARLLRDGADPQRLLLLTFSRRAAQQMAHRAGLMLREALGLRATRRRPPCPGPGPSTPSAPACCANWPRRSACRPISACSTARCRRPDGAGPLGARAGRTAAAFPARTDLPGDRFARRQQRPGAAAVLKAHFPWCLPWED